MKRSVTLKWSNLQVGALVILVSAILVWVSFTGGGTSIFEKKKRFVCYFRNVNGLVTGSPVWMSGLEVGNVRSLKFVDLDSLRHIEVVCAIKRSVWNRMTTEAEVMLGSIGFLGDRYIEIIPHPGEGTPLKQMEVVRTRNAGDARAVFKEAEKATASAGSVIRNLDTLLTRVNREEGTLGKLAGDEELYTRLTTLLARLTDLTADLQQNQGRLVESFERLSTSVSDLSDQVNENRGTMGRLMNDPALYDNLASSTARLDSILTRVNSANGSLGLAVNDTSLYVETANLLTRLNSLLTDMEKNPKKYFKFSIF